MKLLIAVRSCQRDLALHNTIRGTWGNEAKVLGIDTRFFVGATFQKYENDEIHVQANDGIDALAFKTREIFKWATGKQIDYLFLCYPTTPVDSETLGRLKEISRYSVADYIGKFQKGNLRYPWVSGKDGYVLSRAAFTTLAWEYPGDTPEDQWVGQVLGAQAAVGEFIVLDTK